MRGGYPKRRLLVSAGDARLPSLTDHLKVRKEGSLPSPDVSGHPAATVQFPAGIFARGELSSITVI